MKFYRLILLTSGVIDLAALVSLWVARSRTLLPGVTALVLLTGLAWMVLRYPRRIIYKATLVLLAALYILTTIATFHMAVRPPNFVWSVVGTLSSIAVLGSVNLAMLLGHWYLVVRGMAIEPLKRLTIAMLVSTIAKVLIVGLVVIIAGETQAYRVMVTHGIFFWMRVGWGLLAPLALYPMIWGTVKIRSTMAATGILYVAVVAVIIGEVLAGYLSSLEHLPL